MTIDIKAQLELLKELQAIDVHVREVEDELALIPDLIEQARSEWAEASDTLKIKEEERILAEKEKKGLETGLEDSVLHLREREGKLYAIKTNKEYQAALKEIADGKKANRDREDTILKLMEKIERLGQEITQLSSRAAEKESEFRKEEKVLDEKRAELEKQMSARANELEKIKGKVEKSVLEKYNFIRSRHAEPLAEVIGGICQGCNMNVPPQMFIELLKGLRFHFCPSCHRFIYAGEKKEVVSEEVLEEKEDE